MLTDEEIKEISISDDGQKGQIHFARTIERAALAKAMPIPKQEPFGYFVDIEYHGFTKKKPDDEFANCTTALFSEPQPAQAAAIPEGWQLVPVEPTPAMLKEIHLIDEFSERALIVRYKTMLSASPKPE